MNPSNPLIIQSDMVILLEVLNPLFESARDCLSLFAELVKSPEYIHSYQITPLSIWNASSSGLSGKEIVNMLEKYSKHALPQNVVSQILDYDSRYGKVSLINVDNSLYIQCSDPFIVSEILTSKELKPFLLGHNHNDFIPVGKDFRGHLKQALMNLGYPAKDLVGYDAATELSISLRVQTLKEEKLALRSYQQQAVDSFYADGSVYGGSGVVVLPCGAGKTIVGMAVMEKVSSETLILTTGITALRQWKSELLDKTTLDMDIIGEYSGEIKEIKPVTIATYQIITSRRSKDEEFVHFELFSNRNWGLIIYDEVHMLPAPVLRITAEIQAKRRIGLTATLIREDGLEKDVFTLIGPKKYDLPWKVLEEDGFIAHATCTEYRIALPDDLKMEYSLSDSRMKFRIASENRDKLIVIKKLLEMHAHDNVLIIGQYLEQLKQISDALNAPLITGAMKNRERERLYAAFKDGSIQVIVVSKVANFAIDLPDANVLIEVSGMFGSRQEEAQRLGRILRPKAGDNLAWFYTIVTYDTREQDFAIKRQLFLTEQGYKYSIIRFEGQ